MNSLSNNFDTIWDMLSDLQSRLSLSPPGSPNNSKGALGRASSVHSSSSQHSASTVRSKYSILRLEPELSIGAQLADISLTPNLPNLSDIPAMESGPLSACDTVDGSEPPPIHSAHNCCSTCCDDTENESDDEDECESDKTIGSCHCGSCPVCEMRQNEEELNSLPSANFISSGAQVIRTNLEHGDVSSNYTFTEDDYLQYDDNDDYVEFYKEGLHFQMDQIDHGLGDEQPDAIRESSVESSGNETQNQSVNSPTIRSLQVHGLVGHGSASDNDEEHLDYSVESAQDALCGNYSSRSLLNYEGCMSPSLGSESDSGRYSMLHPAAVTMATVTTSTPVAIASSRMGVSNSRSNSVRSTSSTNEDSLPYIAISEVQTANSSEAPAKLITSRHRITVLKAHTQETYSPAATFQAVPLTRGRGHTLPQLPQKPKHDGIQSLQRQPGHFPHSRQYACYPPCIPEGNISIDSKINHNLPVIRKNNYLDVRASSSLNKQKSRMHPRQPTNVTPRSLYLRHQKKELHQQQLREKQERQLMEKQLSSDTVYQPDAYAQGVGVPLQPTPTITGFSHCSHHHSVAQNQHHNLPNSQISNSSQFVCQPYIRNFFQNPPPPSQNVGFESSSCPFGSVCAYASEPTSTNSQSYQCGPKAQSFSSRQHQQQPFASVYTNQVSLSQIEQYNAQLNSDVDYVIYPLQDPDISRQEYMDAKQSQVIANQTQQQIQLQRQQHGTCNSTASQGCRPPIPPYRSPKLSPLYRSTPNVAGQMGGSVLSSYPSYQSLASHNSMLQPGSSSGYSSMARGRYYSQQSLASSLSSTQSGYSASTHSLTGSFDPYGDIVMATAPPSVTRVRSDESILSSALDESEALSVASGPPHSRPPPPYRPKVTMQNKYVQEQRA